MFGYSEAPPLNGIRDEYHERDEATCEVCGVTDEDADVHTVIANSGVKTRMWTCADCGEANEVHYVWVSDYEGSGWEIQ